MSIETTSTEKRQPEALAEFAKSTRHESSGKDPKDMTADEHTKPIATENEVKYEVAKKYSTVALVAKRSTLWNVGRIGVVAFRLSSWPRFAVMFLSDPVKTPIAVAPRVMIKFGRTRLISFINQYLQCWISPAFGFW